MHFGMAASVDFDRDLSFDACKKVGEIGEYIQKFCKAWILKKLLDTLQKCLYNALNK